jgi:hypothetical protein
MLRLPPLAAHPVAVGWPEWNSVNFPPQFHALCNLIGDGKEEDADSEYFYAFEPILYRAAAVTKDDSPAQVRRKIGLVFVNDVSRLYCSNLNFKGGSLIRYAAYMRFDAFIDYVTARWKVPAVVLNQVDPLDGKTVADFLDDEAASASSDLIKQKVGQYRRKLAEAGARNRVELDGIECRQEGGFKPDSRCAK